ncbi:fatty acid cis/trans isomerase [Halarcobacter sp.]|uniref:fatty acid cis/trans isomerase n=1 Tax=Halarcobacter sp. TaxID=2321133 RepID=UPI002AA95810|nr:fatty acid cis/trans isomerase [Halarcobacter sp.]
MNKLLLILLMSTTVFANANLSFQKDIKPILDKRCVVCHSCYNSPCQLKLSSFEGLIRGATKEEIYENRIKPANPSRLFIDASNKKEWEELGFYSVLKNYKNTNIMKELLVQKQQKPENIGSYSPEKDDLTCSKDLKELDKYLSDNPYHGMPYGFPALNKKEHELLISWLESDIKNDKKEDEKLSNSLVSFEKFLNKTDIKYKVTARYIYEHLFLSHIKFDDSKHFYKLIRTYDKQGNIPVKTRVPYNNPKQKIYYKFQKITSTIVHKTHMVYHLDANKLKRYKELFIKPRWNESPYLPSFNPKIAANPLEAFKQIPAVSRYKFMLDNVHYFIMTFIRGPVCKGQVALNVINDQFWVAFKNPEFDYTIQDKKFLEQNFANLALPNEYGGDSKISNIIDIYKYNEDTINYYENKNSLYKRYNNNVSLNSLWKGNNYGKKDNDAILTIYRHFDSASVHKGALGNLPRTMWVIDYPLLERLYYSLVAGFDVYGNTQHKLLVRKYMDRLRIEGESNFLEYLPKDKRQTIFNSWYKGTLTKYLVTYTPSNNNSKIDLNYKQLVENILDYTKTPKDNINYIQNPNLKRSKKYKTKEDIENELRSIAFNNKMNKFKEFSSNNYNLIYMKFQLNNEDLVYTMVINRWHDSVAFMFNEEERLDVTKDRVNFIEGFIGSYPNYFIVVDQKDIKEFFDLLEKNIDEKRLSKFFVNRNNKNFWEVYDWFQNRFNESNPIESGLFDLNRYYQKGLEESHSFVFATNILKSFK